MYTRDHTMLAMPQNQLSQYLHYVENYFIYQQRPTLLFHKHYGKVTKGGYQDAQ